MYVGVDCGVFLSMSSTIVLSSPLPCISSQEIGNLRTSIDQEVEAKSKAQQLAEEVCQILCALIGSIL